jgi:hypothetical protein
MLVIDVYIYIYIYMYIYIYIHRKIHTQSAYHNIPRVKTQKALQQLRTTNRTFTRHPQCTLKEAHAVYGTDVIPRHTQGQTLIDSYSAWNRQKTTLFSGHYLRNRSTLDIGALGYIGILYYKEHPPDVWHIPPGTPCIYCVRIRMFQNWDDGRTS